MSNPALFARVEHRPSRGLVLGFRASAAERAALVDLANLLGVSVSEVLRQSVAEQLRQVRSDAEPAAAVSP
jgi:hypothetical protein